MAEVIEEKPVSSADLFSKKSQPAPENNAPAAPVEPPPENPEPTTPAPAVAPAIAATAEPAPEDPARRSTMVPLNALQAERRKRQELEQALAQAQAGNIPQYYAPPAEADPNQPDPGKRFESQLLTMSEYSARQAHPDFQEKFQVFFEAAPSNPALYEQVMNSDHPAEAAYQAGLEIAFQKKYGTDRKTQFDNYRKEVEAEITDKVRAQVLAEFTGKVAERNNQPTNILSARAAGGGTPAEQRPLGMADLVGRKTKR